MYSLLKHASANLFPGYFSMVMATGALSIGAYLLHLYSLSIFLLCFNVVAYLSLWFLTLIRIGIFLPNLISDLTSHRKGPGFFTLVAGTGVLGSELVIVADQISTALVLWFLAVFLWTVIMYSFFFAVTVRQNKPSLREGINGAWLIAAVATQSVSILGTLLSPYVENGRIVMLFFTVCMYFLGCMLYLNIIALIFYRFTFLELDPYALTPPYWVNMGAVAITTLAGSTLILHAEYWSMIAEITPFLKGFTLFFWTAGSWWIPLLFILMIWRHFYSRLPLKYDPQYWGMAFPLAMYTTSTYQLSQALDVSFLVFIPRVFIFVALGIWLVGFVLLIHHLYRSINHHFSHPA